MAFTRVAYCTDMGVALIIHSELEGQGYHVMDLSTAGHISLAGADQGFYIKVLEQEAASAKAHLKEQEFSEYIVQ